MKQGGFIIPLGEIKSALMIMRYANFLDEVDGVYFPHYRQIVKIEKTIQLCEFEKSLALYAGEI